MSSEENKPNVELVNVGEVTSVVNIVPTDLHQSVDKEQAAAHARLQAKLDAKKAGHHTGDQRIEDLHPSLEGEASIKTETVSPSLDASNSNIEAASSVAFAISTPGICASERLLCPFPIFFSPILFLLLLCT